MKFTIKEERQIKSLKDIRLVRKDLNHKLNKQSDKITSGIKHISTNINAQNVYEEILGQFNLQHSLMSFVPMVLKYKNNIINSKIVQDTKEKVMKPKFVFWTTFVGIFSSFIYYNNWKKRKTTQS